MTFDDFRARRPAVAPDQRAGFVLAAPHEPLRRPQRATAGATEQVGEERRAVPPGKHSHAMSPAGESTAPRSPSPMNA